jgi:hypothetical protein
MAIKIPKYGTPRTITDQQWLDHCNQNNHEFANRQILLREDGPPTNGSQNNPNTTKAPYGSFYKNNLNGDRYEQVELNPVQNGYNWQLFTGSAVIIDKSKSIVDIRDCDSGLAVGDLVWESTAFANAVVEATNNTDSRLIIGICTSKPTSTTAEIMFAGPLSGLTSFAAGKKTYVSTTGQLTSLVPTTGYLQILGNCSDGTQVDFRPSMHHLLRS